MPSLLPLLHILLLSLVCAHPSSVVRSPTGNLIPLSRLRVHHPTLPAHRLAAHLHDRHGDFLHTPTNTFHIPSLAPVLHRLTSPSLLRASVDNHLHPLPSLHVRTGRKHVFVFIHTHRRKILALAWGPNLELRTVHHDHPDILVNLHTTNVHQQQPPVLHQSVSTDFVSSNTSFRFTSKTAIPTTPRLDNAHACPLGLQRRTLELALSFDASFCARYGGSPLLALAAAQALLLRAGQPFQTALCLRFAMVHIDGTCNSSNDQFSRPSSCDITSDITTKQKSSSSCPIDILHSYTSIWKNPSRSTVRRDAAVLLTGYTSPGNIAGRTFFAGACAKGAAFVWASAGSGGHILAHELGHLLGAPHSVSGLMRRTVSLLDELVLDKKTTMTIASFVKRKSSKTCMPLRSFRCDSSCPNKCVNGLCIQTAPQNLPKGVMRCIPINLFDRCARREVIGGHALAFAEQCPQQFGFVQGDEDASGKTNRPSFCCTETKVRRTFWGMPAGSPVGPIRFRFLDGREIMLQKYAGSADRLRRIVLLRTRLLPDCVPPK